MKAGWIKRAIAGVVVAATMTSPLTALAAPVTLPDGTIFDPEYYAQQNPDVVAALGTDAVILYQHYIMFGKNEGRLPYAATNTATNTATNPAGSLNIGQYVTFGRYEQDGNTANGPEPIEWLVLAKSGGKTLLISKYALDNLPYNNTIQGRVRWENCSLRNWLNGSFYQTAFSAAEQAQIAAVINTDPSVARYNGSSYVTSGQGKRASSNAALTSPDGNATQDRVFCLSWEEAAAYFGTNYKLGGNHQRVCMPTAYLLGKAGYANHVQYDPYWTDHPGAVEYWLRSSWGDGYLESAMCIGYDGGIGWVGSGGVDGYFYAVRPAIWVNVP